MDVFELSRRVLEFYAAIDAGERAFVRRSGLSCPPRCGVCCQYPRIKATPLEFLPLALKSWEEDSAFELYRTLDAGRNLCTFVRPVLLDTDEGYCSIYPCRPLICRTFGFLAGEGEQGEAALNTCRTMHGIRGDSLAGIPQELLALLPRPAVILEQLRRLEPTLGTHPMPINQAVKRAIEYVYAQRLAPRSGRPARRRSA